MASAQIGIALALVAAVMANLVEPVQAPRLPGSPSRPHPPAAAERPRARPVALVRRRMGARGGRLADPRRVALDGADLPRPGVARRRRRDPGGDVAAAVRQTAVERRQWLALFLGGAGLALLAVTVPQFSGSHSQFDWAPILGFEGGLALIAAGLALGHRSERLHPHRGILLAVLAGTLFALAGVAIKGLTGAAGLGVPIIAGWVAIIVLCGVLAQYTAVSALQRGGAIETIGLMGLVANATQIAAGVLVFGDPLSSDPLGVVLQSSAFAMVCASALLLPAADRAAPPALQPIAS